VTSAGARSPSEFHDCNRSFPGVESSTTIGFADSRRPEQDRTETGSYAGGLLLLAALGIIAMGLVVMDGEDEVPERTPAAE
jgi:hypothetical protein